MNASAAYVRNDELRRRINAFLQSAFTLPEADYFGRLNSTSLLALKSALSDINNAVTMQLTLGFLDWASKSLPIDELSIAQIRASVLSSKPSSNGYDIVCTAPLPFVAEVKCNIPVNGGMKYGAAQKAGILKDIYALTQGKSKARPVVPECLKFMVFLDLPQVRAANNHLMSSATGIATALQFLQANEVPSDPAVIYGVYASLGA